MLAAIVGTALFVTIVAMIAFGVGSIVRHTAGTIAIVIALMFIIPLLENTLPSDWHDDIMRFLPDAANQVVSLTIAPDQPEPLVGVAAARRDRAVGGGPGRHRRLPLPQARRLSPPPHAPATALAPGALSSVITARSEITDSMITKIFLTKDAIVTCKNPS